MSSIADLAQLYPCLKREQLVRIFTVSRRLRERIRYSQISYADIVAERIGSEILNGISNEDANLLIEDSIDILNSLDVKDLIAKGIRVGYKTQHPNSKHASSVVMGLVTISQCVKAEIVNVKESKRERLDAY